MRWDLSSKRSRQTVCVRVRGPAIAGLARIAGKNVTAVLSIVAQSDPCSRPVSGQPRLPAREAAMKALSEQMKLSGY